MPDDSFKYIYIYINKYTCVNVCVNEMEGKEKKNK